MESKPFLKKLREEDRLKRPTKLSYFGLTWNQWAKFTKMASTLDHGCNFNANGKTCTGGDIFKKGTDTCCCSYCSSHVGYIKFVPNNEQAIKEIASVFDPVHGFWRKEKGCILPLKYRSYICIAYRCREAKLCRAAYVYTRSFESFKQMILHFLDACREGVFNDTQIRTIIKELLKTENVI